MTNNNRGVLMVKVIRAIAVLLVLALVGVGANAETDSQARVVVIPLGGDSLPTGVLSGQEIVSGSTQTAGPSGAITGSLATCPNGKIVLGGGFTPTDSFGNPGGFAPNPFVPQASYPSSRDTWSVVMENTSSFDAYFRVYAICAKEN